MQRKKKERDIYKYKTLKEASTNNTKNAPFILYMFSFSTQILPKNPKNGGMPPKDIKRYTNSVFCLTLTPPSSMNLVTIRFNKTKIKQSKIEV